MKRIILIVVPVLVVGGVVAVALLGAINIPGLTPKKHKGPSLYGEAAVGQYAENTPAPKATEPEPANVDAPGQPAPPPPVKKAAKPVAPTTDPEAGNKKLAKLWNEMKPEELAKVVEQGWSEAELAQVFNKMEPDKAAKVLALMKPAQASKVSRELQKEAAKLKPEGL